MRFVTISNPPRSNVGSLRGISSQAPIGPPESCGESRSAEYWADSYDRDLTDIFTIQSEVAQTIADRLTAALSPEERKSIDAKPTSNLTAYDLY